MSLDVKDAGGTTRSLATGSGDGSGTPYKSPAAVSIGATDDAAAGADSGTFSLISLTKRLLARLTALLPAALSAGGGLKVGVVDALPAGANSIGTVELGATALAALETITVATVQAPLAAGTNVIGGVAIDQSTPGTTNAVMVTNMPTALAVNIGNASASTLRVVLASDQPVITVSGGASTTGGATPYSYIAAATANQDSQVVKASAGQIYGIQLLNTSNANRYVKFYNLASGATSASTPVKRLFVPAGGGISVPAAQGIAFDTGIMFRITTGVADNDANAATANDVLVNVDYK